jgi:hypothetical protein
MKPQIENFDIKNNKLIVDITFSSNNKKKNEEIYELIGEIKLNKNKFSNFNHYFKKISKNDFQIIAYDYYLSKNKIYDFDKNLDMFLNIKINKIFYNNQNENIYPKMIIGYFEGLKDIKKINNIFKNNTNNFQKVILPISGYFGNNEKLFNYFKILKENYPFLFKNIILEIKDISFIDLNQKNILNLFNEIIIKENLTMILKKEVYNNKIANKCLKTKELNSKDYKIILQEKFPNKKINFKKTESSIKILNSFLNKNEFKKYIKENVIFQIIIEEKENGAIETYDLLNNPEYFEFIENILNMSRKTYFEQFYFSEKEIDKKIDKFIIKLENIDIQKILKEKKSIFLNNNLNKQEINLFD